MLMKNYHGKIQNGLQIFQVYNSVWTQFLLNQCLGCQCVNQKAERLIVPNANLNLVHIVGPWDVNANVVPKCLQHFTLCHQK